MSLAMNFPQPISGAANKEPVWLACYRFNGLDCRGKLQLGCLCTKKSWSIQGKPFTLDIAWSHLLQASLAHVLSHYNVTAGVLVLDDSDKVRSRNTYKIAGVHKVKDKKKQGSPLNSVQSVMSQIQTIQVNKRWHSARFKNKHPGMTVGCLVEHINAVALIDGFSHIVYADEPKKEFDKFKTLMEDSLPDRTSKKHMSGLDLGRMEPTPSLIYKKAA